VTTKLNQEVKINSKTRTGKRRMRSIGTLVQEKVIEMIVEPVYSSVVVVLSEEKCKGKIGMLTTGTGKEKIP